MTPTRQAIPAAPVMHPNLRVSDLINQVSKDWDVGLLENYVNPDDIPLTRSLAISSTHRRDTFCWNYTRNDQYTVKSGYWVARNLLKAAEEKEVLEPSITKLQAFAWKLKAPTKICHLIWQLLTGHVAVTRNLTGRNMRRIDKDSLELVRHAESKGQAWFDAKEVVQPVVQDSNTEDPEVISLVVGTFNYGTINFSRRESALHSEVEALPWAMENMIQHSTCQSFGTDCKELIAMIKEPHV
ncbi:hypothetical protein F2Q69_00014681 [Brassica cretica]|uniref:Reverse transcriptase zinc-binding domain-containing protein n=1 Tax=Brassica cretica TaxID=69181 RepID=A0A8S9QSA9_BRACR|nr:hypothetical protein F2Q69_00014681 [Brassica cretica]